MANETTYALIQSWLPDVVEATEMYLMKSTVMPPLVQVFTDRTGVVPRRGDKYNEGTVGSVAETTDLTTWQAFTRTPFGTVTPSEVGAPYILTDLRMESDNTPSIMADLTESNGYVFAKSIDVNLTGLFSSFTGGTIGAGGSAMTWEMVQNAYAIAVATGVPGPYNLVLHPFAALSLMKARANAVSLVVEPALKAANRFYVGSFGDVSIWQAPVMTAGTAVVQGLFSRRAIALDIRRALRIEAQRDASLRSTEVITTMVYGYGVWRASYGVKITSDASTPT